MEILIQLLFILLVHLMLIYFWRELRSRSSLLTNWPVLGMIPSLTKNAHRFHDFATQVLRQSHGTFPFKGPLFLNKDFLFTCDPANIHYILSKNFKNYPKGPEVHDIFRVLGDGILNADGDLWEIQRKTTMSLLNHSKFYNMLEEIIRKKIEEGLIPLLDHVCQDGIQVDFQEIFQRLTFDNICSLLLHHDPQSLSLDLPCIPFQKTLTVAEEALFCRFLLPECFWKLQSWIGFGREKVLSKCEQAADEFIYRRIPTLRHELKNSEDSDNIDPLTDYMETHKGITANADKLLRDNFFSLITAGTNTTSATLSWFFWLLSRHPLVESKIQQEIQTNLVNLESRIPFNIHDLRKLVYLHGALCEALRLYPPVAFSHKAPVQPDILPSGHRVKKDSKIMLSFYPMGRMETIWGKDCLEFKPERWISEKGEIKHVASYKFPAFSAGPRTCLGKGVSFTQMKMITTTILYNYRTEVVEGQAIVPSDSVVMQMKYGLKMRLTKRSGK